MIQFEEFWRNYPRRVGKHDAKRMWDRMNDQERAKAIASLQAWKRTKQWNGDPDFIPYGSTFLHQERYNDEPTVEQRETFVVTTAPGLCSVCGDTGWKMMDSANGPLAVACDCRKKRSAS
jgi:hypothetical protein